MTETPSRLMFAVSITTEVSREAADAFVMHGREVALRVAPCDGSDRFGTLVAHFDLEYGLNPTRHLAPLIGSWDCPALARGSRDFAACVATLEHLLAVRNVTAALQELAL